ncbi:acyl-CoA dehydrogenase family protein [Megasphaera vaginalis (ex Bordigoni et al. 2020)]|uniref:acyl-CoA dehydrogenase family protein n=1 Tax=Megasphaera vaginalis (ex Bordigoni et al. 2020) TaxID=2045301 RepID=UPI000C7B489C|nr:acyl-CoA dehydrogenase family protein [Megasphaera vaginalis (ex Bordigoni et al. 2020)]
MDFELSAQEQEIVNQVREFTQKRLAPGVVERDEKSEFPLEAFKEFGNMGMYGLCYPQEFGGTDTGYLAYILAVEEVSKVDASFGIGFSVNTSLYGGSVMYSNATDEQKKRFLSPIASGKAIGSFGLTEASAGSDAAGQQTIATPDGDGYVLNGTKIFNTNGPLADYTVVYCLLDPSVGTKSMAAFVVEKGTPGFHVGKIENKMGIRSAQVSEMVLSNVKVSADQMIAKPGEGFKLAMKTLDGGRIGVGAQALGIAEGAFEIARDYLKQREQFGKPLFKQQYLAFKMAELYADIEKAKLVLYKAAKLKEAGKPFTTAAAIAKMTCTDVAMKVTTECVQMLGGNGYMKEYHVERMMRDAKITQIYEGTNEIQKLVISGGLFR